jgi:glycerol-3-phosphate dehydrogenase (NAD(P)+)
MSKEAAVIGAGSWGTAFCLLLSRQGIKTRLWVREEEIYQEIKSNRTNNLFLPGFILPPEVLPCLDLAEAIDDAEMTFVAVPSRFCRGVYLRMAKNLRPGQIVVSLTKGLEEGSLMRMTEIMARIFPPEVFLAVLSGPSFAREVASGWPTAVVVASEVAEVAEKIQRALSSLNFRVYTSPDVKGVEIAGAVKNVIALAAGISDGLGFGHNARASLITRGLVEITRLGLKLGAKQETFYGLAGIGDLVLTATGLLSRNYQVGFRIGQGEKLPTILAGMKMVAEAVPTSISVKELATREGIEMPICHEVYQVLHNNKDPRTSLIDLMSRSLKGEPLSPGS